MELDSTGDISLMETLLDRVIPRGPRLLGMTGAKGFSASCWNPMF
jgi:hypothetical protein